MVLFTLAFIALLLTMTMFLARQSLLAFPSGIFWFLFGAYAYSLSTRDWTDWQYWIAIASMLGMTIFCVLSGIAIHKIKEPQDLPDDSPSSGSGDSGNGEDSEFDGSDNEHRGQRRRQGRKQQHREKNEFDTSFFDQGIGDTQPSRGTQSLRERADQRRTRHIVKSGRGEFRW